MFKRTRIRLVVLNSIVFFFILSCFGATLYLYMQVRLSHQVTATMQEAVSHAQHEGFRDILFHHDGDRQLDPQIFYILWGQTGELVGQTGAPVMNAADVKKLGSLLSDGYEQTATVGGQPVRIISVSMGPASNLVFNGPPVRTIQFLYRLAPMQSMLHSLLIFIESGILIGAGAVLLAGLFLANRALIPIQLSWNKQQQFVADASHELRTPLTVVQLQLEQLFRHPSHTIEKESEKISGVIQETKRITKLVTDLLTLARSDSNEAQILLQNVRLDSILHKIVEQFREIGALKQIEMDMAIDSPVEIRGDEERLQQLFIILLDNAMKYTNENGRISVSCHRQPHGVEICVRDTGIGIHTEDLPFVFDRFFRGDKVRSRANEGSGLGLSIAKWIVGAHGGSIRAESTAGVGTSVCVNLPSKVGR